ncbi:MAG: aminoglycoside phosphotransferase family protein [Clostridia bacterium]|nr:aminoglycoside phosphotransferase family protein [Clostridia bacterium]
MEILRKAIKAFIGDVDFKDPVTVGNGHINSTYLVKTNNNSYCLQKINTSIFRDLDGLMNNIEAVTEHIREKSIALGRNPYRSTLKFLTANTGKSYVLIDGAAYRMYHYIDDVFTIEKMEKAEHFYLSGVAFGEFARFLSDFDASVLSETIKNFHNTVSRYNDFEMAIEANASGRADQVADEIAFVRERKAFTSMFVDRLNDGSLPLRVTHNDTKLNNVLFDNKTETPVAVIDLDTVMPGSYLYDFGDAIRSGATHAAEDEQNLDLVDFDLELYKAFAKGYLEQCGKSLTEVEIELLPYASIMLTLECGIRFLTDHINGDTYFRIHRENHNLDRCRTQFKLVAEMEKNLDKMKEIINSLL